jgi:hypothetical protein
MRKSLRHPISIFFFCIKHSGKLPMTLGLGVFGCGHRLDLDFGENSRHAPHHGGIRVSSPRRRQAFRMLPTRSNETAPHVFDLGFANNLTPNPIVPQKQTRFWLRAWRPCIRLFDRTLGECASETERLATRLIINKRETESCEAPIRNGGSVQRENEPF